MRKLVTMQNPPLAASDATSAKPSDPISPSPASPTTILQHTAVPAEPNVYVLGSYEGRVTIHSQQIRALNLLYALKATGKLDKVASRVAVVGGGIAGMTAAIAAAKLDANVTIFERHPQFLHNLRGCHTRHLHPNIYDWPHEHAMVDATSLPFMNWHANTADQIARDLLTEWSSHVQTHGIITHASAAVMLRAPAPNGTRRITVTSGDIDEPQFDIVILAVGFGVEKSVLLQPLRSYWRDDSLHQPEIEVRTAPTKYLVSGNGDGGLIDVLRLRLVDFRHEDLIKEFGDLQRLDGVIAKLKDIETDAKNSICTGADPSESMYFAYKNLPVTSEFDAHLQSKLRKDTQVIFNFPDWPFSYNSSILHRFLVSRLLKIDAAITILPGQLLSVEGHEPNLTARFKTDSGEITREFDRLVIRHGPQAALGRDFPHSNQQFESILRARNALDETRIPAWPQDFWGKPAAPQPDEAVPPLAKATVAFTGFGAKRTAIGMQARLLRDELLRGAVTGLEGKINQLESKERNFLLDSLGTSALTEEGGLKAFEQLLSASDFSADQLRPYLSQLVKDALFRKSAVRKAQVLALGAEVLQTLDEDLLGAFFSDIFDIVDNDQFSEVNVLVPALVEVDTVIPTRLYSRYVSVLINQSRSNAIYGAPAAKKALFNLDSEVIKAFLRAIDLDYLNQFPQREQLQRVLDAYKSDFPEENASLLNDFIGLEEFEFDERYNR
jgi:hypothetical protein